MAQEQKVQLQHYRGSMLGQTLDQALSELCDQKKIEDTGRMYVLNSYDAVTNEALAGEGVLEKSENSGLAEWYSRTKVTFKGHLHMFRGVDNVWTLLLTEGVGKDKEGNQIREPVSVKIEPGNTSLQLDALKIVAMQKQTT
mmetsp:Transcript_27321/g.55837  ORF Transcript_27321/g.55837 Transcript_27321/m.55837 type:complete len:141 (+) Transcript_27321:8-430(+)|eukprot:CAMPEP_0181314700 /NCGR_PEP_ID=MMETSP1101-20121128/14961_1 /TAXON_ID=46948 /ORGANISM="Rhodomonas abbreviata, Strain Caron Lab Isolate" /LENGTH=140 /DNA_ID=CAMNT_0023421817 /DNA_START=8 /DNA_END=430 /DNA_ORIENTATION=+